MQPKNRVLRFSGSTVKSWFQYRCDRKTRYETLSADERAAVPVLQVAPTQCMGAVRRGFRKRSF